METSGFYLALSRMRIEISLPDTTKRELNETPRQYFDFRQKIKLHGISDFYSLKYMDDFGELLELKDQDSYEKFVLCSNGLKHYVISNDIMTNPVIDVARDWPCPRCTHENLAHAMLCAICKFDRSKIAYQAVR
jgi:hypothetical protein